MSIAPPYTAAFLRAIGFVLPHEDEFARGHWGDEKFVIAEHDPDDAGGTTKYGIDARSHRGVDIERLTRDQAVAIYWQEWLAHRLDLLPSKLAVAMFDVQVNGGHPVQWLQQALNEVVHPQPPLVVDGWMGAKTYAVLNAPGWYDSMGDVLRHFIAQREARFEAIIAANPRLQKYHAGWSQRDRDLAAYLS